MSTCQAKNGEFECGLLPLKDGLCEQHYRMYNNNESATKDCHGEADDRTYFIETGNE